MVAIPVNDERRRVQRIPHAVRLEFSWKGQAWRAKTQDLNRVGALIASPVTCPAGTLLDITNLDNGRTACFRVAWAWFGDTDGVDRFKLGLEAAEPKDDFWGLELAGQA